MTGLLKYKTHFTASVRSRFSKLYECNITVLKSIYLYKRIRKTEYLWRLGTPAVSADFCKRIGCISVTVYFYFNSTLPLKQKMLTSPFLSMAYFNTIQNYYVHSSISPITQLKPKQNTFIRHVFNKCKPFLFYKIFISCLTLSVTDHL